MKEKCFILEYKCKDATPGRYIIIAKNGHEALSLFMNDWVTKFESGEVDIPTDELQDIEIQEWCNLSDMIEQY